MRDYWREEPPPHVVIQLLAARFGIDFEKLRAGGDAPYAGMMPTSGPSIAEIAAKIQPPRGDTLAASKQVFRILNEEHANGGQ